MKQSQVCYLGHVDAAAIYCATSHWPEHVEIVNTHALQNTLYLLLSVTPKLSTPKTTTFWLELLRCTASSTYLDCRC